MKFIYPLLLCLTVLSVYSQPIRKPESNTVSTSSSVNAVTSYNQSAQNKKLIDSLNRELQFYKIKDSLYATAIDRQASHFDSLYSNLIAIASILISLIAIVAPLAGFISYRSIDNNIKSKLSKQDIKIEELKVEYLKLHEEHILQFKSFQVEFYDNLFKTYVETAVSYHDGDNPLMACYFYEFSIDAKIKTIANNTSSNKRHIEVLVQVINTRLVSLIDIIRGNFESIEPNDIEEIKEETDNYMTLLNDIKSDLISALKIGDENLIEPATKCITKLLSLINYITELNKSDETPESV